MSSDAIDIAYTELAHANLGAPHLRRHYASVADEANRRLEVLSDRALSRVCAVDIDDAVLNIVESGIAQTTHGGYTIRQLLIHGAVFSPYAQWAAEFFENAATIGAIDIRDKNAAKDLAENEAFKQMARKASPAWTMRSNMLFRDIAVIGAIFNFIDPIEKKLQLTRPARALARNAGRDVRNGPAG